MITIRCLNEKKSNVSYTLLVGKTYSVGRKGGDISFPDDQSVSRNHAEISVEHPIANVSDPLLVPIVVLTDLGSKFGTFANEGISNMSPLSMREPMNLCAGDKFRFGRQWNVFEIEYTPLVITTSTLKDAIKLKKVVMTLGGHMVNEWNAKCDFIVMESLTLTVKAVCGILSGKHIVLPSYFDELYECVQTKRPKPDPKMFLPPLGEKSLEADGLSFDPNPERKKLFEGKTFVFASQKQMSKLGAAVACGGGKVDLISNIMSSRPANMKNPNFIMLSPGVEPAMLDSRTRDGIDSYKRAKKRLVLDSEIGLAAIYNSIEKHCNPCVRLNVTDSMPQKLGSQTQQPHSSSASQVSDKSKSSLDALFVQPKPVDVKVENDDDDDIMISEVIPAPKSSELGTSKRSHNGNDSDAASSSKKRAAADFLSEDTDTEHDTSQKSSKRMKTSCHDDSEQSQKALSCIFGMSSDEEDESSEFMVSRIPETQDNDMANTSVEIVTPTVTTRVSPDLFEISDSLEPSGSNKRKNYSPDTSGSTSQPITELPSAKRCKINDATDVDGLESKTEKLCIETTEIKTEIVDQKLELGDLDVIDIPVVVLPLLKKHVNRPTFAESADGRRVKNFKRFHKSLPISKNSTLNSENNVSIVEYKLTFIPYTDATETDANVCPSPNQARVREEAEEPLDQEDILGFQPSPFGASRVQQPIRNVLPVTVPAFPALPMTQGGEEESLWDF